MKVTKKIVKIGASLGVILDKVLLESIKLKKGDLIEVDIKKVKCQ